MRHGFPAAAVAAALALSSPAVPAAGAPSSVCVLDFLSLDRAEELGWLEAGLADMMIRTLRGSGAYRVLERRHLREILQEHELGAEGVTQQEAVHRGRLVGADFVLLGSFGRVDDQLVVQARLLRLSDQTVMTEARWSGTDDDLLTAPAVLTAALLDGAEAPDDHPGLETQIPHRIDVARSYYTGVRAFDDGLYPEALAHYVEAADTGGAFSPADDAVLEMYYLLDRAEHAVLFAGRVARAHEKAGRRERALAYHYAAAARALDPLGADEVGASILEKMLGKVDALEAETGQIARTKDDILQRLAELRQSPDERTFGKLLSDGVIRYQMWSGEIDDALVRRTDDRARGGFGALQDGKWVVHPVPEPTLLMWRVRAQRTLARVHARDGRIRESLDLYHAIIQDHEFLAQEPDYDPRLMDRFRSEAHFMMLRHYGGTGELVRDHAINLVNRLNRVEDGAVFQRDFASAAPDPRARVTSRYEGRGSEYFDFAAPPGFQVESVKLRAEVTGLASFSFARPNATGWPPHFSFGTRVAAFDFRRGTKRKTVRFPVGTEMVSIGTSWGLNPYESTPADEIYVRIFGPKDGKDLVEWRAEFSVVPKTGTAPPVPVEPKTMSAGPYAEDWDAAFALPVDGDLYTGSPRLDVYAEDWHVYDLNGDLRIVRQQEPHLEVELPVAINTDHREFAPSLVRTHEGAWALLWARGTGRRNADRFVAISRDFLEWDTPRRLAFEELPKDSGYTYGRTEPPERTHNIVAVRDGYLMLLAQGFARRSDDLRHWEAPERVLPHDTDRNRLTKTADGVIWAIWETWSEELHPYKEGDWLHGFYVTDGKRYRHTTELHVARSGDGVHWIIVGKRVLPGQGSALWAFPIDDRRLGIGMGFNNLFVSWFAASEERGLRDVDVDLRLMHQSQTAGFYVTDGALACVRPVFDSAQRRDVLVGRSSEELYREMMR